MIDFKDTAIFTNQGIGIKSHFGNNPTILNASHATNFIYKVENLYKDEILKIQNANYKVKDAVCSIYKKGGQLTFIECENPTYNSTLKKIDSNMPKIISEALQLYYQRKIKYLHEYINFINEKPKNQEIECRLHDFIKNTMLGIFPTKTWNGELVCNGSVVINKQGELTFFHTNRDSVLKQYFYSKSFFDTPSMTRHRFGQIYNNTDSSDFLIKLNLQIRLSI